MKYANSLLTLAILAAALFTTANAQTNADKAFEQYLVGRSYLLEHDYRRAVEAFSGSIALKPTSNAYKGLGMAYHHLDRHQEALAALTEAVRGIPQDPEVHYFLAFTYESMGIESAKAGSRDETKFRNAEAEAREALRLRPNYFEATWVLADSFYKQGKYPQSVAAAERALTLKRDDQASLYTLALGYARLGRRQEAMQVYEKLSTLDAKYAASLLSRLNEINGSNTTNTRPPSSSPASAGSAQYYFNEGDKYRDAENYTQAITAYKRAIGLNPSLAEAHYNLGFCQYKLHQYSLALPPFQQAVKLDPSDASKHFWLGATYYQLKRYQQALASLQESIRLKPDETTAHHWLGDVYAEGFKQYDKAIPEYLESIRLDPAYAIPRNQLGLAYTNTDDLELAIPAFLSAIKLKPAEPLYYSNLGYAYLWLGHREDAVMVQRKLQTLDREKAKTLADAIEAMFPADHDDAEFLSVLATVVRDRPATALIIYRRVLFLSKTPEEKAAAYRGMGQSYKAKGNEPKAIAAYQQALPIYQRLVRLKPNEGYLLSGLGHTYLGLGQRDQAIAIYRKLQTLAPDHAKDLLDDINKAQ